MLNIFFSTFGTFLKAVFPYVVFFASPFIAFVIWFFLVFVFFIVKHRKLPPQPSRSAPKRGIFLRIFWDFPKQFWSDYWSRDPEAFREYGLHIIAGEQGSGKTITCAYLLREMQRKYSKVKVRTNFFYQKQDGPISHWKDFIFQSNGVYGEVIVLDEIQNWFSSMQSKDFPPDMLQEITQQRKQRKMIIGTSQVFTRVAKPIREQTTFLYEPFTILGCMTVCRVFKPVCDDGGQVVQKRPVRTFFFVHDHELRESFDTYHKIETLSKKGFVASPFNNEKEVVNLNVVSK